MNDYHRDHEDYDTDGEYHETTTDCSWIPTPSFTPIRVLIKNGAWEGKNGWITGYKNEVGGNPITLDSGISLVWFDSEITKIIK